MYKIIKTYKEVLNFNYDLKDDEFLIIDMSDTIHIRSEFFAGLLVYRERIKIVNPTNLVLEVFKISRIDHVIPIYKTIEEARLSIVAR